MILLKMLRVGKYWSLVEREHCDLLLVVARISNRPCTAISLYYLAGLSQFFNVAR